MDHPGVFRFAGDGRQLDLEFPTANQLLDCREIPLGRSVYWSRPSVAHPSDLHIKGALDRAKRKSYRQQFARFEDSAEPPDRASLRNSEQKFASGGGLSVMPVRGTRWACNRARGYSIQHIREHRAFGTRAVGRGRARDAAHRCLAPVSRIERKRPGPRGR